LVSEIWSRKFGLGNKLPAAFRAKPRNVFSSFFSLPLSLSFLPSSLSLSNFLCLSVSIYLSLSIYHLALCFPLYFFFLSLGTSLSLLLSFFVLSFFLVLVFGNRNEMYLFCFQNSRQKRELLRVPEKTCETATGTVFTRISGTTGNWRENHGAYKFASPRHQPQVPCVSQA
jgi:hypothetical protein